MVVVVATNPETNATPCLGDDVGRGSAHMFREVSRHPFLEKRAGWMHVALEAVLERVYVRTESENTATICVARLAARSQLGVAELAPSWESHARAELGTVCLLSK